MPTKKLQEEEDKHLDTVLKEMKQEAKEDKHDTEEEDQETEDMFALMNQIKNARETN